jgi:hypothetical protein
VVVVHLGGRLAGVRSQNPPCALNESTFERDGPSQKEGVDLDSRDGRVEQASGEHEEAVNGLVVGPPPANWR